MVYKLVFVSGVQQSDLVIHMHISGLPWWLSGKNPPAIAGDAGLIPESERSPGEGNNNPICILPWKIPWTEEPGGLQSTGSHKVTHYLVTKQQ